MAQVDSWQDACIYIGVEAFTNMAPDYIKELELIVRNWPPDPDLAKTMAQTMVLRTRFTFLRNAMNALVDLQETAIGKEDGAKSQTIAALQHAFRVYLQHDPAIDAYLLKRHTMPADVVVSLDVAYSEILVCLVIAFRANMIYWTHLLTVNKETLLGKQAKGSMHT